MTCGVDAQAVASVVADWTGIPVGRMVKNEVEAVLKLGATLNERVIGQRHALNPAPVPNQQHFFSQIERLRMFRLLQPLHFS